MISENIKDIETSEDIDHLLETFYTQVYQDDVLRPMFEDVAKIDFKDHLPVMNRFWNNLLFGTKDYQGNPFAVHAQLHGKSPLSDCHFIRWLSLFCLTVDKNFSGPTAELAKRSAESISYSFQIRLNPNSVNPLEKGLI